MINSRITSPAVATAAFGGFVAGALTGATAAAARNLRQVKDGTMTRKEAAADVIQEASSMGIAGSIGVGITAALGLTGAFSIVGVALISSGAKYGIDSLLLHRSMRNTKAENTEPEQAAQPEHQG